MSDSVVIFKKNLETEYKLEVSFDPEKTTYNVTLQNKEGEFVGNRFSNLENLKSDIKLMTNGSYSVTKDDEETFKDAASKTKGESLRFLRSEISRVM